MARGAWTILLAAPTLVLAGGCLAFVTPPATVTVAPGPAVGQPAEERAGTAVTQIRADLHPLGLAEEMQDRRYDLFAGGVFDLADGDMLTQGMSLGGAYFLVPALPDQVSGRVYVSGHADWLWAEAGGRGPGLGAAIGAELVGFVSGGGGAADKGGAAAVGGHGEMGIGAEIGVDGRFVGRTRYALIRVGLRLRMPLSGGIVMIPGLLTALR